MAAIPFTNEPQPVPGAPMMVAPGVLRITAPNGGPLTCHGTNSYIVATPAGNVLIDPGPDDRAHVDAVLAATGGMIAALFVTHGHGDHAGAAAAIRAATGAPVHASPLSIAANLVVDVPLGHGDVIHGLRGLRTPGHSRDHMCFAGADGVLFTGDHVMTWSTTAVSPPNGSMIDYRRSLQLLLDDGDWRRLLPGHGAPSEQPAALISALLAHRVKRERQVLSCVRAGAATPSSITDRIYGSLAVERRGPAERTVLAYLMSLAESGAVRQIDEAWLSAKTSKRCATSSTRRG